MTKQHYLATALILSGVAFASAKNNNSPSAVIRGEALVQAGGKWAPTSQVAPEQWIKGGKVNTAVKIPGAVVRLEPGTSFRYTSNADHSLKMDAKGGRLYVALESGSTVAVATEKARVSANTGEFVVDSDSEKLYVVSGDAKSSEIKSEPATLKAWDKQVALDGPDVRKRNKNRKRFTQGEENAGKRIGEDNPPQSPSPSPTFTQTPAYTPSPTYTPPPQSPVPSPTPPPQQQPVVEEGGGGPDWGVIGGIAGAGGLAAFLLNRDDDNDRPFFMNPVSR